MRGIDPFSMAGNDSLTIQPSTLSGTVNIPPSKSHTLRSILFASLANGQSTISNYLPSNDTNALIQACRSFGATITSSGNRLTIKGTNGTLLPTSRSIDAGNSGIILRFCTALSALSPYPTTITGDQSICTQRPMAPLLSALNQLGADARSIRNNDFAPLMITGPLKSTHATIKGEDSQHVSALLIAGAFAPHPVTINVTNPGEKPWVALTLSWLDRLNIPYINDNFTRYQLNGNAFYEGFSYTIPSDFSSAAFPIAAALITGSPLTLTNIDMKDVQGDKEVITLLKEMGANITYHNNTLSVLPGNTLKGISIDINPTIDAITILAVVACFAEGETHIYNGAIARHKECDRIHCIAEELKKMGADITEQPDGLLIKRSHLHGAKVNSYNDHRMAMSLAVAAFAANGPTTVENTSCIEKTFPQFQETFQRLGAQIEAQT